MDRRRSSLAANPLLIGALTTLIVAVAVYLSYNALNGLPFTPTYDIQVELNQANGLLPSNEVRIGGARVGLVNHLTAVQSPATGRVAAIAYLKLEKGVQPLPANTVAIVQSVSALGLKYLELIKGRSLRTLPPGGTLPASQTREPVQIEELFKMFDQPTRTASQTNLNTFGDTFAGRGGGLNQAIHMLPELLSNGIPVLHNLASRQTDLHGLWVALEQTAAQAAPVAQQQANFYVDMDTFFSAFASVAPELEQTIAGGPAALHQAIFSLPYQARFVDNTTEFFRLLRPSAKALASAAAPLGDAFATGAVNLTKAIPLNAQLATTAKLVQQFIANPVVVLGFEDFTQTAEAGNPLVAGLAPAQTTCNYLTLFFRNIASLLSQGTGVGTMARVGITFSPLGPNAEGGPSSAPANGGSQAVNSTTPVVPNNFLHFNPYPNVGGPGQPKECEAGNEKFIAGQTVIGNVPGNSGTTHDVTTRSQNLLGLEYPSATLRDLGIKPSSSAKKSASASTGSSAKKSSSTTKGSSAAGGHR